MTAGTHEAAAAAVLNPGAYTNTRAGDALPLLKGMEVKASHQGRTWDAVVAVAHGDGSCDVTVTDGTVLLAVPRHRLQRVRRPPQRRRAQRAAHRGSPQAQPRVQRERRVLQQLLVEQYAACICVD